MPSEPVPPIPEDLRDEYSSVMDIIKEVSFGACLSYVSHDLQLHEAKTKKQLIERIARLEAENAELKRTVERLSAKLSPEEKEAVAFRFGGGAVENEFERIIAARKEPNHV